MFRLTQYRTATNVCCGHPSHRGRPCCPVQQTPFTNQRTIPLKRRQNRENFPRGPPRCSHSDHVALCCVPFVPVLLVGCCLFCCVFVERAQGGALRKPRKVKSTTLTTKIRRRAGLDPQRRSTLTPKLHSLLVLRRMPLMPVVLVPVLTLGAREATGRPARKTFTTTLLPLPPMGRIRCHPVRTAAVCAAVCCLLCFSSSDKYPIIGEQNPIRGFVFSFFRCRRRGGAAASRYVLYRVGASVCCVLCFCSPGM